jgi:hypothetical protein
MQRSDQMLQEQFHAKMNKQASALMNAFKQFGVATLEADASFFACTEGLYFRGMGLPGEYIMEHPNGDFHSLQQTEFYLGEEAVLRQHKIAAPLFVFEIPEGSNNKIWRQHIPDYIAQATAKGRNWFTLQYLRAFTRNLETLLPYAALLEYLLLIKPFVVTDNQRMTLHYFVRAMSKNETSGPIHGSESAAIAACMAVLALRMKHTGVWK